MKTIQKITTFIFLVFTQDVRSANIENAFGNSGSVPRGDIIDLINPLIAAVLGIAATIAVMIMIVGGFQYVTAAGNPDSIQKAKNAITYATLGLIAAILGYAIITFILTNIVR